MKPASTFTRSLAHLACAGKTAALWHASVVVRRVFAKLRKYDRARRDEIVME